MHDTFKHGLGPFHPSTIHVLVVLNLRTPNVVEGEKMLRELVAQSEYTSGVNNSSLLMLMMSLGYILRGQRKYLEAEELGRQMLGRAEDIEFHVGNQNHKIQALELIAYTQYSQNKMGQAEKTMRDVIEMIVDQWGVTDPGVIENTVVLERWLRSWGREEEANNLKADIEEFIGKDEIDGQSAGEQSPGA